MSGRSKSDPERAALESAFARARDGAAPMLPPVLRERLEVVLEAAESGKNKAALAVVATLLVRKAARPEQNIRFHQAGMPGGFSGRGLDERLVTPFMKTNHFPAMISGSGWLTRSIGQPLPYNADYPGNIRPPAVKSAFLGAVDEIQSGRAGAEDALAFLLAELIARRDASAGIKLNRPVNLTVAQIIARLTAHFARPNSARLPTLAVHAVYQRLTAEMERYNGCSLLPLEPHTAADGKTGALGDVQVNDADGLPVEAVEIKHNIPLTAALVRDCRKKFQTASVRTFYLLSTSDKNIVGGEEIKAEIDDIRRNHGCQMIVNGITPTLKYYLRLLKDASAFVNAYVAHLETDPAINYALKEAWNELGGDNAPVVHKHGA